MSHKASERNPLSGGQRTPRPRALPFRDPHLHGELLPKGWPGRRVHKIFIAAHDALHEPADCFVRGIVAQHSP